MGSKDVNHVASSADVQAARSDGHDGDLVCFAAMGGCLPGRRVAEVVGCRAWEIALRFCSARCTLANLHESNGWSFSSPKNEVLYPCE